MENRKRLQIMARERFRRGEACLAPTNMPILFEFVFGTPLEKVKT
jgi:hypothetical protein